MAKYSSRSQQIPKPENIPTRSLLDLSPTTLLLPNQPGTVATTARTAVPNLLGFLAASLHSITQTPLALLSCPLPPTLPPVRSWTKRRSTLKTWVAKGSSLVPMFQRLATLAARQLPSGIWVSTRANILPPSRVLGLRPDLRLNHNPSFSPSPLRRVEVVTTASTMAAKPLRTSRV